MIAGLVAAVAVIAAVSPLAYAADGGPVARSMPPLVAAMITARHCLENKSTSVIATNNEAALLPGMLVDACKAEAHAYAFIGPDWWHNEALEAIRARNALSSK